jgi:predicted dehydrogenase
VAAHPQEFLIVGIGAAAQTHLKVLEQIPDAVVVAGVDTAGRPGLAFRGQAIPVYATVGQARDHHAPGAVVVATPTPSHSAVCDDVADSFPAARILVEKPAAGNLADARHVLAGIGGRQPVDVAYHMSFSPEVTWGLQLTQAQAASLGEPAAIEACFTDPYQPDFESAQSRFGSSWIDSGINSLSILNRFAELTARSSLRSLGEETWSAFEAHVTCRAGSDEFDAVILTSWHVTDAAKTTRIRYSSGAELVMDHTAVAGYLVQDSEITGLFGSDRSISRRERHYRALYDWWLADGNQIASTGTHLRLHEILLQPPDTAPG